MPGPTYVIWQVTDAGPLCGHWTGQIFFPGGFVRTVNPHLRRRHILYRIGLAIDGRKSDENENDDEDHYQPKKTATGRDRVAVRAAALWRLKCRQNEKVFQAREAALAERQWRRKVVGAVLDDERHCRTFLGQRRRGKLPC